MRWRDGGHRHRVRCAGWRDVTRLLDGLLTNGTAARVRVRPMGQPVKAIRNEPAALLFDGRSGGDYVVEAVTASGNRYAEWRTRVWADALAYADRMVGQPGVVSVKIRRTLDESWTLYGVHFRGTRRIPVANRRTGEPMTGRRHGGHGTPDPA